MNTVLVCALMAFNLTTVAVKNDAAFHKPGVRLAANEGGTSSSKTFSILQLLTLYSQLQPATKPLITSVVSESLPHLRKSALRDWFKIMGEDFREENWNATELIYKFSPVILIEFFSADQPGKASGPRRDILFVNEVNNVPKTIFDQLDMRTRRFVFVDFNPVEEFWLHGLKGKPDVEWIHSTYLDAEQFLDKAIVDKIEAMRERDPNGWRIYGLGLIGNIEGLVHPLFSQVEALPEGGIEFFGLDYGYSNDPTCLTRNKIIGEDLYSDELIYEKGLDNNQIAKRMIDVGVRKGYDEIFCDAAEPKSRDEIMGYGFNIKSCPKGPDSVRAGIQLVNQYRQHWTKRSVNGIKEQRNYRYITDKDGQPTNKPMDNWNHCFAGDTLVLTDRGWTEILNVKHGDMVASYDEQNKTYIFKKSYGCRLIDNSSPIIYLQVSGVDACRCTEDHQFLTGDGWQMVGSIEPGSKIIGGDSWEILRQCRLSSLSNTESGFAGTKKLVTISQVARELQAVIDYQERDCIALSMSERSDRYPMDSTFITSISTEQTILQKTSSRYLNTTTKYCTEQKKTGKRFSEKTPLNMECLPQGRGTQLPPESNGTGRMQPNAQRNCLQKNLFARIVDNISGKSRSEPFVFVQTIANRRGAENQALTISQERVRPATSNSQQTNIPAKYSAQDRVLTGATPSNKPEPVYCMEVEDTHNFIVYPGLVAANCMDSRGYGVAGKMDTSKTGVLYVYSGESDQSGQESPSGIANT